jgi:hypothetical protein
MPDTPAAPPGSAAAFAAYLGTSAELGDVEPTVCTAHGRFVPCRSLGFHVISSDPADVALVQAHQQRHSS